MHSRDPHPVHPVQILFLSLPPFILHNFPLPPSPPFIIQTSSFIIFSTAPFVFPAFFAVNPLFRFKQIQAQFNPFKANRGQSKLRHFKPIQGNSSLSAHTPPSPLFHQPYQSDKIIITPPRLQPLIIYLHLQIPRLRQLHPQFLRRLQR